MRIRKNFYEHNSDLHSLRLPISYETKTKFHKNFTTEGIELDRTNLKSDLDSTNYLKY